MTNIDHERAERFQSAFPARTPEMVAKHRRRALGALAAHVCSADLTDGFCSPEFADGKSSGEVRCRREHTGRSCVVRANSMMRLIEGNGCTVVWAFDREMGGAK